MEGGILIEHGHRLLASLVGLLCMVLFIIGLKNRKEDQKSFCLSAICFFLVIFQGGLGGITVIYKLPTIVSTFHLAVAMIFFCLLIFYWQYLKGLRTITLSLEQKNLLQKHWNPSVKENLMTAFFFLYVQILLGAFVRHSGAGASCGLGIQSAFLCMDIATWTSSLWPSMIQGKIHMLHRYFGVFVFGFSLYSSLKIITLMRKLSLKESKYYITMALTVPLVLLLQIALGIMTVVGSISLIPTTAHLAVAAISLGLLFVLVCEWSTLEKKCVGKKNLRKSIRFFATYKTPPPSPRYGDFFYRNATIFKRGSLFWRCFIHDLYRYGCSRSKRS